MSERNFDTKQQTDDHCAYIIFIAFFCKFTFTFSYKIYEGNITLFTLWLHWEKSKSFFVHKNDDNKWKRINSGNQRLWAGALFAKIYLHVYLDHLLEKYKIIEWRDARFKKCITHLKSIGHIRGDQSVECSQVQLLVQKIIRWCQPTTFFIKSKSSIEKDREKMANFMHSFPDDSIVKFNTLFRGTNNQ